MDRARYAVDAVVVEGRSIRSVASSIDMSKSWVAKQVTRYRAGSYEALVAQSTGPTGDLAGSLSSSRTRSSRSANTWMRRASMPGP